MAAPGNLGLYDQIAALRWVKRNIQSFGGNNDDITLMGHNAGAISASLLLLAPHETQGLIDKALIIGGSAFSPATFHWNPRRQSREFARELRCMDEQSDKIIRCLRLKDWRLLVAASRLSHNFESNTFRYWFRPVIDRNSTYSLIRDYPQQLYASGSFLRVPLMGGVSSHEGSLEFFINWRQLRPLNSLERIRFLIRPYLYEFSRSEIVATTLDYNYVKRYNSTGYALNGGSHFHHNGQQVNSLNTPVVLADRLTPSGQFWHEQNIGLERNEYDVYISPNDQRSKEIAREIDAIGDFLFVAPLIKQLELHSQSVAQTYMFVFDYKGSKSFGHIQLNPYGRSLNIDGEAQTNGWLPSTPSSTGPIISSETSNFGVAHNDDLFYVLPNDFAPLNPQWSNSRPFGGIMSTNGQPTNNNGGQMGELANDDNAIRNYVTYLAAYASRVNEMQASNNLANWLPFRSTDRNYIRFSEQLPTLYKNFHQTDVAFVNELVEPIEELVNTPLPLFPYEELRDFKVSTAALAIMLLLIVLTLLLITALLACRRRRRRSQGGFQRSLARDSQYHAQLGSLAASATGAATKPQIGQPTSIEMAKPDKTPERTRSTSESEQQGRTDTAANLIGSYQRTTGPTTSGSAARQRDDWRQSQPSPTVDTGRLSSVSQTASRINNEIIQLNETRSQLEGRLSRLSQRYAEA
jgi:carboxylesterase type B/type II secretory pathway pseudopilin PulG